MCCPWENHLIFHQAIVSRKIAVFIHSVKTHWNTAQKSLRIISAVSPAGRLQAARGLQDGPRQQKASTEPCPAAHAPLTDVLKVKGKGISSSKGKENEEGARLPSRGK